MMVKDVSLLKSNLFGHRRWHILCTVNLYRLCVLLSGFLPPASPFYIMSFEIVSPSCKLYFTAQYERERKKKVECSLMFLYCSLCTDSMEIFSSSSSSSYFASSPSVSGSTARGLIKRDQVDPNCRRTVPYRAEPFRSARASEP